MDTGTVRRRKILTSHEFCGKRRSFSVDLRVQTDKITQVLLQRGNSDKIFAGPWELASFDYFKFYRGIIVMDGELVHRTVIQRLILKASEFNTLLSGWTCTSTSTAEKVSFKG